MMTRLKDAGNIKLERAAGAAVSSSKRYRLAASKPTDEPEERPQGRGAVRGERGPRMAR